MVRWRRREGRRARGPGVERCGRGRKEEKTEREKEKVDGWMDGWRRLRRRDLQEVGREREKKRGKEMERRKRN